MENSTKTLRTLWICVPISMILVLVMNELVLPVMAWVKQLKQHVSKRSLQRSLNNQILDYKAILDLCENEMMSIKFFGICEENMISVENLETEKWYEGGDTVPVTGSSDHLVPLSSSRIGSKLASENESYVDIQSISLCNLCIQLVLVGLHCYFSWYSCMKGHGRPLISINVVIHAMLLWKALFKRYQLLLHLLGDPAFAKLQK